MGSLKEKKQQKVAPIQFDLHQSLCGGLESSRDIGPRAIQMKINSVEVWLKMMETDIDGSMQKKGTRCCVMSIWTPVNNAGG